MRKAAVVSYDRVRLYKAANMQLSIVAAAAGDGDAGFCRVRRKRGTWAQPFPLSDAALIDGLKACQALAPIDVNCRHCHSRRRPLTGWAGGCPAPPRSGGEAELAGSPALIGPSTVFSAFLPLCLEDSQAPPRPI